MARFELAYTCFADKPLDPLEYIAISCGDQPSLRTWTHLTFTAPTILSSANEAQEAPVLYKEMVLEVRLELTNIKV